MNYMLVSLLFKTSNIYKNNLELLLNHIENVPSRSIVVAPEVCLTGFDYENLEEALDFAKSATKAIKKYSTDKIIIFSMLERENNKVYNFVKVFYNGEVVYKRAKARLFRLGDEHKFMEEGSDDDFKIIEVDGIKIAILICFELRFKELWEKAEGADVIAIPSWWGKPRSEHFKSLTKTLAIMNQCYVVASDSQNEECTQMSSIVTPKGEMIFNGNSPCLKVPYIKKDITLMRRYLDVGIE